MHRTSETIGAIAVALSKAQGGLSNPENSAVRTIRAASFSQKGDGTQGEASLAGLDVVRKTLGQHEIRTIQTTTIDQISGQIWLTIFLTHASGEWISSDWPVCASTEIAAPHRLGIALNHALRSSLFVLLGITDEDDLNAPDPLIEVSLAAPDLSDGDPTGTKPPYTSHSSANKFVPLVKPIRHRSKAHLAFVRSQPCLVCQRSPCDAHHLKFAEPRAMGRKVSDEFTVPLCRDHHNELHKNGNERAWWANMQISPLKLANELWQKSQLQGSAT